MTQTPGEVWARLRRPLLDPETRFAWTAPLFAQLRLRVEGREQPLDDLFARVLFNDADRQVLAVGFSEAPHSRVGCDVVVRAERLDSGTRLEVALCGRLPKELHLGDRLLASHPGAADAPPGTLLGPFAAVAAIMI